jgi:predicted acyltransferase
MSFDPPASRDITEVEPSPELIDQEPPASPPPTERLMSIDALRGFDMFWIIGGDAIARALTKWWGPEAKAIGDQFDHVDWQGFRFYDLIFPLFLFTVGVVLPFSLRKHTVGAHPKGAALVRIARRVLLLFLLGLVVNRLLRFDFENLRYPGVLQRIAICYGAASLIFLFTTARTQVIIFASILIAYWALLTFVPSPESKAGDYSMEHNLAGYIDRHYLPGKINPRYYGFGDNEGLLSSIPAVCTTLLGVLAGHVLLSGRGPWLKALSLALMGVVCLGLGVLWGTEFPAVKMLHFPIIKILWTGSFVLVAGGLSLLLLSLFYTVIDVLKLRGWAFFFMVIGVNAITIYVGRSIVPFDEISQRLFGGVAKYSGSFGPAVVPIGTIAIEWLLLLHLYRNKIFLRV